MDVSRPARRRQSPTALLQQRRRRRRTRKPWTFPDQRGEGKVLRRCCNKEGEEGGQGSHGRFQTSEEKAKSYGVAATKKAKKEDKEAMDVSRPARRRQSPTALLQQRRRRRR